ncbi:MAG: thioredoxin domain-containing protein [Planctomycetota bacterium]
MIATTMVTAAVCSVSLAGEPEVFSDAGYEADRAAAIEQDRLHLVYATASWCPPCRRMKTTTWVDESVESWVADYGIVTALDVDEFPQIAGDLGVRAMPTMILFEGGEELGRTVGYQSAADLVAWMEAGRNGEELPEVGPSPMPVATDEERAEQRASYAEQFAGTHANDAAQLFAEGEFADAAAELRRVWPAILDAADPENEYAVGGYIALAEMLARSDEASRAEIAGLRDDVENRLKSQGAQWHALETWVDLNMVLQDYERVVAWARRIAERPNGLGTLQQFEWEVLVAVQSTEAWDVTAATLPKPVSKLALYFGTMKIADYMQSGMDLDDPMILEFVLRDPVISALFQDDDGTAEREVVRYLETYASDDMPWQPLFIKIAHDVGKLRDDHRAWIDEYNLRESHADILEGIADD